MKLKHLIPLQRGDTFLSLYSSPDAVFCLTSPLTSRSVREKKDQAGVPVSGKSICLIRTRSATLAADWMWDLWRELGNSLPEELDVAVDGTDLQLRFCVPEKVEGIPGEGYKALTSQKVVDTALGVLDDAAQWSALMKVAREQRTQFELAWRRGCVLDWVCYDRDIEGRERDWAVLSGYPMRCVSVAHLSTLMYTSLTGRGAEQASDPRHTLEVRPALHYPTTVLLPSGQRVVEPPAVEGYLTRIKPRGGRERVYLHTHDFHLCVSKAGNAQPPLPPFHPTADNPGAIAAGPFLYGSAFGRPDAHRTKKSGLLCRLFSHRKRQPSDKREQHSQHGDGKKHPEQQSQSSEDSDAIIGLFLEQERQRMHDQIAGSRGYTDLRDIRQIRRCGDDNQDDQGQARDAETSTPLERLETSSSQPLREQRDDSGQGHGNDSSLHKQESRSLRMFEIEMNTGRRFRLEVRVPNHSWQCLPNS
jgi:hypothetical protein